VDAIASRQIKDLLLEYVRRGGTVFLTSHILEVVERLCDHIGVIHKGRLVAQGPAETLRSTGAGGETLEAMFLRLVGATEGTAAHLDWLAG
jgi:ABC-2 type transport system ATP-binding protein